MKKSNFLFERSDFYPGNQLKKNRDSRQVDSGIGFNLFDTMHPHESLFRESLESTSQNIILPTPTVPLKLKKRHLRTENSTSGTSKNIINETVEHNNNNANNNTIVVSTDELSRVPFKKPSNKKDNTMKLSPVVFDRKKEILSQCNENADWQEILRWKLCRRDVGLWVFCCRKGCNKKRFVDEYHDPTDVPEIWYCEMNSDKSFASCDIPEEHISPEIERDLIENDYNAGSIVWARILGTHPWWPGIVNDSPDTFSYYELSSNSLKPRSYFVTFFDEKEFENAWVQASELKPFKKYKYSELVKRTKYNGVEYKQRLKKAYKLAESALPLSIFDRLQKYSYLAIYSKLYNSNDNPENNTQMEMDSYLSQGSQIPSSCPTREQFSLHDHYLRLRRKK